jgi:hypothetical protein
MVTCVPPTARTSRRDGHRADDIAAEGRERLWGAEVEEPHVEPLDTALLTIGEVRMQLAGRSDGHRSTEACRAEPLLRNGRDLGASRLARHEADHLLRGDARGAGRCAQLVEAIEGVDGQVPPIGVLGDVAPIEFISPCAA